MFYVNSYSIFVENLVYFCGGGVGRLVTAVTFFKIFFANSFKDLRSILNLTTLSKATQWPSDLSRS